MKYLHVLVLLTVPFFSMAALANVGWTLAVIGAKEQSNYPNVTDDEQQIHLINSHWKCLTSKTTTAIKNNIDQYTKEIVCKNGNVSVRSALVCPEHSSMESANLSVIDKQSDILLVLSCVSP